MPSCSPFAPIRRTSRVRMRSLTRRSLTLIDLPLLVPRLPPQDGPYSNIRGASCQSTPPGMAVQNLIGQYDCGDLGSWLPPCNLAVNHLQ